MLKHSWCFFFVFFYSKGSVIAAIKLIFNPEFAKNDNETTLANAVATGKVGSLEVDKDSFRVVGKQIALFIYSLYNSLFCICIFLTWA